MLEWIRSKFRARRPPLVAWIVDPEAMTIEPIGFDGNEKRIPALLGYDRIDKEVYHTSRVYFGAENAENEQLYGFVIEHTGGTVNHGRCLVIGSGTITYRFIPGYGAVTWTTQV